MITLVPARRVDRDGQPGYAVLAVAAGDELAGPPVALAALVPAGDGHRTPHSCAVHSRHVPFTDIVSPS